MVYTWSTGAINPVSSPGPDRNTVSGLAAGSYTVNVSDASGCGASATATVSAPPAISVSVTPSSLDGFGTSCNGSSTGSITSTPSGGTGTYTYSWSSLPTGFTSGSENISSLPAKTYIITVSDNNGCSTTASSVIADPAVITATYSVGYACSGSSYTSAAVTLNASGGASGTYNYKMDAGSWQSSPTFSGLANSSTHTFYVEDASYTSCTNVSTISVTITFPANGTSVSACNIIYVSTSGDPAGTIGSQSCPASLTAALSIFAINPSRNIIQVATGTYTFSSTISLPASVIIDGGYDPSTWIKSTSNATVLNINPTASSGHYIGLQAAGNNFQLKDLTVNVQSAGASGTYSNAGNSVYGLYTSGYTGWLVSRCVITTGAGSAGSNGTYSSSSGGGYSGGGGGFAGYYGSYPVGSPTGGGNGCNSCGGSSGDGGAAGSQLWGTESGGGGAGQCCSSGCNIFGCNASGCNAGNGGSGANGYNAPGMTQATSSSASGAFYTPVNGTTGYAGDGGAGGGGGANTLTVVVAVACLPVSSATLQVTVIGPAAAPTVDRVVEGVTPLIDPAVAL